MQIEQLIISLIKDDLINNKLVSGLNQLGLCASDYHLHLSETIFKLMGMEGYVDDDKMLDHYLELIAVIQHVDISDRVQRNAILDKLAQGIYSELIRKKPFGAKI